MEDNSKYWALILGGSSGLGLASAKKLSNEGFNICIIHRDRKADLPKIKQEIALIKQNSSSCLVFNIDALNIDKRNKFISEFKAQLPQGHSIKALIHSIAKGNLKAMNSEEESTLGNDDFRITLDAMAISLYDWTQAIFEQNIFASDARIISFTSEGNQRAWKNYAAVSAAKAALEAITRNIALEFARNGIRANCIQAGMTDTRSFQMIPNSDKLKSNAISRNPFGRMTTPEDVADLVYLLTKSESAWINGAIIPVDGGERFC